MPDYVVAPKVLVAVTTGSEIAGGAAHGFMPLGARRSLDSDDPLPELGIPELNDGEERVCCGMVDLTDNSRNRCENAPSVKA